MINFKLGERRDLPQDFVDDMSRTWVGWAPDLTDQQIYDQNRGLWVLGARARKQQYATFSYAGTVKVVVQVDDVEDVPSLVEGRPAKSAIVGSVLSRGDDAYDQLIDSPVDGFRNPVSYPADATSRSCGCGCGHPVTGARRFVPGHDQRAVHERIAERWGDTLTFVQWFDTTYRGGTPTAFATDPVRAGQ